MTLKVQDSIDNSPSPYHFTWTMSHTLVLLILGITTLVDDWIKGSCCELLRNSTEHYKAHVPPTHPLKKIMDVGSDKIVNIGCYIPALIIHVTSQRL